jgi:hypothetical protein
MSDIQKNEQDLLLVQLKVLTRTGRILDACALIDEMRTKTPALYNENLKTIRTLESKKGEYLDLMHDMDIMNQWSWARTDDAISLFHRDDCGILADTLVKVPLYEVIVLLNEANLYNLWLPAILESHMLSRKSSWVNMDIWCMIASPLFAMLHHRDACIDVQVTDCLSSTKPHILYIMKIANENDTVPINARSDTIRMKNGKICMKLTPMPNKSLRITVLGYVQTKPVWIPGSVAKWVGMNMLSDAIQCLVKNAAKLHKDFNCTTVSSKKKTFGDFYRQRIQEESAMYGDLKERLFHFT